MKKYILSLLILLGSTFSYGQAKVLSAVEKKADFYQLTNQHEMAEKEYKQVLSSGGKDAFIRVSLKLAHMFYGLHKYDSSVVYFENVQEYPSYFSCEQAVSFVTVLVQQGSYYKAAEVVEVFLSLLGFSDNVQLKNLNIMLQNIVQKDKSYLCGLSVSQIHI